MQRNLNIVDLARRFQTIVYVFAKVGFDKDEKEPLNFVVASRDLILTDRPHPHRPFLHRRFLLDLFARVVEERRRVLGVAGVLSEVERAGR